MFAARTALGVGADAELRQEVPFGDRDLPHVRRVILSSKPFDAPQRSEM
jgi:hypothetical protein